LEWKEKAYVEAIKLELLQLFDELKALHVMQRAEVNKSAKVLKARL
jgi:hypothetical protein